MAITRAQMRRQLYRGGGIASVPRRQKYGLGDFVRKLIPNEIANVASKAAPFVAMIPGGAPYAAVMRGVGRYDKRGDLGDALKQGALTYGFGEYVAPSIREGVGSMFSGGASAKDLSGVDVGLQEGLRKQKEKSMFGKVGEFLSAGKKKFGEMGRLGQMGTILAGGTGLALLADKLVGPKQPDESMDDYLARRKSSVSEYLRFYYKRTNPLAGAQEVDDFVASNTPEYANGGRVGYNMGSPREELDAGAQSITYEGNMNPNTQMASAPDPMAELNLMYQNALQSGQIAPGTTLEQFKLLLDQSQAPQQSGIMQAAKGGRVKYNMGTGSMGLPGAPRMAPDGIEYDMRENGGFQPLGAKEGKDDVKAVLAKNEFVMTADAVRAAGGGSIQKGAQRMYDTMKRLESRVA